ncbi:MAG: ABC transporter ATP-binding protein [Rhodospirillaceae bacterium]|nr:ABC transporter ATP-binding protein [Rhodospirillaceae bacterium]MDE0702799.1 ABC transporter ATP-binding protein [Rhodospirillaceae bacterium]MXW92652.1 ABC transporter ATP-binding protein [Rhodospirillaceae bacterium]MYB14979.1 ABC transporter ATP-binding protein [Rhodospirillaceae bacterium]MYG53900.1 ABC transporter ATP-binding protein [Rhodospirillaceae bacterium]
MDALLSITGVSVRFGGVNALADVGFDVPQGALLGLIGPNGAGKTTMMRAVTGMVRPQAGSIVLDGVEISRLPTHRRVRLGLGLSQQIVRPFAGMTAAENVALAAGYAKTADPLRALATASRDAERERARTLLDLVGIADAADALPAELPLGYLKRVEVARALALDPKVLLLDEPLAGLNTGEAARLADTVVDLNRQGTTVVLIEHNLSEVMRVCRHLVVLDNGRKIGDGDPAEVMADPAVRDAYLGAPKEGSGEARHAAA